MVIDKCSDSVLLDFRKKIKPLTQAWAENDIRPHVKSQVLKKWDKLLDAWVADEKLPLFIRKSRDNRGMELKHNSKRIIIPADNGPAHWAMVLALDGQCPTLEKLKDEIKKVPVAMALKKTEKKTCEYKEKANRVLNKHGWKLCHIDMVKLNNAHGKDLRQVELEDLIGHFRKFISPRNMFLVPKNYSGFGEIPEMLEAIRKYNKRK